MSPHDYVPGLTRNPPATDACLNLVHAPSAIGVPTEESNQRTWLGAALSWRISPDLIGGRPGQCSRLNWSVALRPLMMALMPTPPW